MPDLMQVLISASKVAPLFIMIMQGVVTCIGFITVASALIDFYLCSNENTGKMFTQNTRPSIVGGMAKLVIGAFLVALGTLQLVGIISRTLTGDYVNSRMLSYSSSGTSMSDNAMIATMGLLSIMQAIGFTAIYRGFMALIARANGDTNGNGFGIIATWFIGGILAWNFKWTADIINNTLGFDIITKLTPFG